MSCFISNMCDQNETENRNELALGIREVWIYLLLKVIKL